MTMKVALHHKTSYHYDRPVNLSPHIIRLRPAPHCRMSILAYSLKLMPANYFINWQQDPFGNHLARVVFPEKTRELIIEVDLVAELPVINPFDFFLEEHTQEFPFNYEPQLLSELSPYFKKDPKSLLLQDWLKSFKRTKQRTMDYLMMVNARVKTEIQYVIRMDPGVQSCVETLQTRKGSCRDLAWLLVQTLRHVGFAARFASGYLIQLKPDREVLDNIHPINEDFTDLHAWVEVYLAGAGWVGLDPTSGLLVGECHIPVCCTPDPVSAAPVTGNTDVCQVDFDFTMSIKRIIDVPPITKPFSDNEWQTINELGQHIDSKLNEMDVRLTMGAEPSYISIDHRDDAQWNVDALGKQKREKGEHLLRHLFQTFAKGGILQYGQGKWCSGEAVPRWALNCYWRKDNVPLWTNPALFSEAKNTSSYDLNQAQTFTTCLVNELGLNEKFIQKAYEQKLNVLRGFVLPLICDSENNTWLSEYWRFPQQSLQLIAGDSALGYRLPLSDVIHEDAFSEEKTIERAASFQVTEAQQLQANPEYPIKNTEGKRQKKIRKNENKIITALCVEVREGSFCIFLPPLDKVAHYFYLLQKIEFIAQKLQLQIVLEGYDPPRDPLLLGLRITPDPGVLEVNIQPAYCWDELVGILSTLYEEARLAGLGTEKFMLDGRQVGTGGGCHITLGGSTVEDSPFLRRSDLLGSFLRYFQNHPSLSYFFSGQFIGPTSQAPRIDEARHEALYELEIALQQIPMGKAKNFWLIDRLLRNLLVDITGNTHRTEICIDKLFAPETLTGRQGLIELRAFEMAPNSHLCLLQMLLIRGLVSCFWEHPYSGGLIRWGTELHDKFMLPHFIWQDFLGIINMLNSVGYDFKSEWFESFFEFKFPQYGNASIGDINLELRMALEPWNVLGEAVATSTTSRSVDSAVERIQVKITGINAKRYTITCNSRKLPLHPTGKAGEFIAGVRFKAWKLHATLHPNIPAHKTLVFDIYDTWNKCSLGGCTYYVSHPGGRTYEKSPVNKEEAEGRRLSRFETHGHTPNMKQPPTERPNNEFPYTLDLRRPIKPSP